MHQKAIEKILELVKIENERYNNEYTRTAENKDELYQRFVEWEIEFYQKTDELATLNPDMDTIFYIIEDTLIIDNSTADELMAIPLDNITYFHAV